jgi:dTDP-4-amino-4,6-dideoxygalactose transaminase
MIPVTKPFLPDIEAYQKLVAGIWERRWLTNNGPLVIELEDRLKEYLDLEHLLFLSNGTIAIQIALKALDIQGEVITTPFSYVATTSSIVWEGATPVFVDIDENTLNIDVTKIEAAITPKTQAILATHVFGNACNIEAIEKIATTHHLKVIYDAAHCFGTLYKGKSIFTYGDVTTTSFHATKLFHTIEGGAVFAKDAQVLKRLGYMRNFGHEGPESFEEVGINGKNSEFHAAMGLCNLVHIEAILAKRKEQSQYYDELLRDVGIRNITIEPHTTYNYAYYPVIFKDEEELIKVQKQLNNNWIYPRRYFYPSLNTLAYIAPQRCPISEKIASTILCLPLYHDLKEEEMNIIISLFKKGIKS